MSSLDRRIALVTGAGGGIGAATCCRLSKDGAVIVAADVNFDSAVAVAEQITQSGGKAMAKRLNVVNQDEWRAVISDTLKNYGGLDILVNNAGVAHIKPLEAVSFEEWTSDINVNLNGAFLGIKASLEVMRDSAKRTSGGSIINIASVSAIRGSPGMPAYSASKGGLRLFSKAIAVDFARAQYGIRVNTIFPGLIDTSLTKPLFESQLKPDSQKNIETIRQEMIDRYPIGRIGKPEEIASVVSFLAGDDSSYMVGAELVVDGGLTAG
jgi:NAD(P)-dependent dehydrogenase (short-subunit alcohol dehydrogenase family)